MPDLQPLHDSLPQFRHVFKGIRRSLPILSFSALWPSLFLRVHNAAVSGLQPR